MAGKLTIPDRYEVSRVLGKGGMGKVYLARDKQEDRDVALKVLSVPRSVFQEASARFRREARAQGRVENRHVVGIYDYDFEQGTPYLAMELVQGRDLDALLKDRPRLPLEQVQRIARELGEALDALHAVGVLHRDLKPSNIMIRDADGSTVLMDLGLARVNDATALTGTGQLVGTPVYLPPEAVAEEGVTWSARSDVYQMGAILFELLTGERLLKGSSMEDVMRSLIMHDHRDFPADMEVPLHVEAAIRQATAADPDERFPSAGAFAAALAGEAPTSGPASHILGSTTLATGRRVGGGAGPLAWLQSKGLWAGALVIGIALGVGLGGAAPRDLAWELVGDAVVARFDPNGAEGLRIRVGEREARGVRELAPGQASLVFRGLPPGEEVEAVLAWDGGRSPPKKLVAEPPAVSEEVELAGARRLRWTLARPAKVHWEGAAAPPGPSPPGPLELTPPPVGQRLPALAWEERGVAFTRALSWGALYRGAPAQVAGLPGRDAQAALVQALAAEEPYPPLEEARTRWRDLVRWLPEIFLSDVDPDGRRRLWDAWQTFQRFEAYDVAYGARLARLVLPAGAAGSRVARAPREAEEGRAVLVEEAAPLVLGGPAAGGEAQAEVARSWPEVVGSSRALALVARLEQWPRHLALRLRPAADPAGFALELWHPDPFPRAGNYTGWLSLLFPRDLAPAPGTAMVLEAVPVTPGSREQGRVTQMLIAWPQG